MKKTNFTFSGTCAAWLLRSFVPVLFFMTLSLGVEAQVVTPDSDIQTRMGVNLVDNSTAATRLGNHIQELQALNPTTPEEEADQGIRLGYAMYIVNGISAGKEYAYHVLNSMDYLENRVGAYNAKYRPDVNTIYNEMVDLFR